MTYNVDYTRTDRRRPDLTRCPGCDRLADCADCLDAEPEEGDDE